MCIYIFITISSLVFNNFGKKYNILKRPYQFIPELDSPLSLAQFQPEGLGPKKKYAGAQVSTRSMEV